MTRVLLPALVVVVSILAAISLGPMIYDWIRYPNPRTKELDRALEDLYRREDL